MFLVVYALLSRIVYSMHFGKYTNNYPPIYFLSSGRIFAFISLYFSYFDSPALSEMSYAWDNQDFVDLMRVLALIFFILLFMAGLLLAMEVIFKHFNIDLWTASPTNDGHPWVTSHTFSRVISGSWDSLAAWIQLPTSPATRSQALFTSPVIRMKNWSKSYVAESDRYHLFEFIRKNVCKEGLSVYCAE